MTTGRGWATCGFLLGVVASISGNVAHARPTLGAQLAAGFYPVALLLTVEVLARTSWPSGRSWWAVRFGGAGLVAGVAAIVSYVHLNGLLVGYGESHLTALLGPLSVDGLMLVCGFALLAIGRGSHGPVGDPLSDPVHDPVHIEVERTGPVGYDLWDSMPPAVEAPADADPGHIERDVQERQGDPVTLATEVRRRSGRSTRDRIADYLTDHPHAAVAEIAREIGVSESTVKRHRRDLRTTTEAHDPPGDPLVTPQMTL